MRIACYLRVSTDQQSHDSQRNELEGYCQRRGWMNVHWFTDTASGVKQGRDGLASLMDQVRRGKVDVVVAYKLDRLARSLPHLCQLITELKNHHAALICPSQGVDTSVNNPSGMLQLNVLAAVAEFERSLLIERVNSGLAVARKNGTRLGRPPKAHRHAAAVATMVAEGLTPAQIGRELAIPYSSASEMVRELRASSGPGA